ncbi:MAG: hypothetical protein NTY66_03895 [Candidatus Vogelbacteria bacterium]|nr:hypothetical protein [Candidatus Vogelbacteria bacterium]
MNRSELVTLRSQAQNQETNAQVVTFTRLFINDVLKAHGEVVFDKRLELENAVRALKDQTILAQWGKFINAKDELTAQTEVKNLLGMLVDKITVK